MRSVKLILVLILFGVALIIAAVVPPDINGTAGSSALGSRVMGLLGVAYLVSGLVLRQHQRQRFVCSEPVLLAGLLIGVGPVALFNLIALLRQNPAS